MMEGDESRHPARELQTAPAGLGKRLRNLLFVPGDAEEKIGKAIRSQADAVVIDLEDAVSTASKASARQVVRRMLSAPRTRPVVVRVNAADTPWHLEDVAVTVSGAPDALMLPKCMGGADLVRLDAQICVLEAAFGLPTGRIGVIPLATESAGAVRRLDYVDATPRLVAVAFAAEDLAADLGVQARDALGMNPLIEHARRALVFAAAEAGVPALDTPFPEVQNLEGLIEETRAAVRLGFAGKLCIHPAQLETVEALFRPSAAEMAWAQAVARAFAASAGGVATLNGQMIDRAHLQLAQRYLQA